MSQPGRLRDWTKPAAMAIPKEGFFQPERGRFGQVFPRTPANYGFSVIAKVKFWSRASYPRVHQCPRFFEYVEYPYVSADEIKQVLRVKALFSGMLD